MSLFIKGDIKMPQSCKSCPFNYTDVCVASNKGIDTRTFEKSRHPDCPMVEIPTPHGRLIDADALLHTEINLANYPSNYVRIAPTIIEAEMN